MPGRHHLKMLAILLFGTLIFPAVLGCGGNGPTSPSASDRLQLPLGPYTLMANVAQEQLRGCAATGLFAVTTFSFFTRVTLSHEGTEWVARSATSSDGTVELRF